MSGAIVLTHPVELLELGLQCLAFQLLHKVDLAQQPHLARAQDLKVAADAAVQLRLHLGGHTASREGLVYSHDTSTVTVIGRILKRVPNTSKKS